MPPYIAPTNGRNLVMAMTLVRGQRTGSHFSGVEMIKNTIMCPIAGRPGNLCLRVFSQRNPAAFDSPPSLIAYTPRRSPRASETINSCWACRCYLLGDLRGVHQFLASSFQDLACGIHHSANWNSRVPSFRLATPPRVFFHANHTAEGNLVSRFVLHILAVCVVVNEN